MTSLGLSISLSCSRIDWGLSLAPRYISSTVDDAFDIDSKEKQEIKSLAKELIDAIYSQCLSKDFDEIRQKIMAFPKTQLDRNRQVAALSLELKSKIKPLRTCIAGLIKDSSVRFIYRLNDHQVSQFVKHLEKVNAERDHSQDELIKQAQKRFTRIFEYLCVDLSSSQHSKGKQFFTTHSFPWSELQNRRQELIRTLSESKLETKRIVLAKYLMDRLSGEFSEKQLSYQAELFQHWTKSIQNLGDQEFSRCQERFVSRIDQVQKYFKK